MGGAGAILEAITSVDPIETCYWFCGELATEESWRQQPQNLGFGMRASFRREITQAQDPKESAHRKVAGACIVASDIHLSVQRVQSSVYKDRCCELTEVARPVKEPNS